MTVSSADYPLMERAELPAVATFGGTEFQHAHARLWAEMDSGAEVHVMSLQTGRHRAWLVRELPAGCEVTSRIGVHEMKRSVGRILDDVRNGAVFEIFDHRAQRVRGYLMWTPPDSLAALADVGMQYAVRVRPGRVVRRVIYPLAVQAEREPRRKRHGRVMANA